MLNQFVGVGRLVAEPSVKETEDGKQVSNITIAVPRSYKNENGEYDTDFLDYMASYSEEELRLKDFIDIVYSFASSYDEKFYKNIITCFRYRNYVFAME